MPLLSIVERCLHEKPHFSRINSDTGSLTDMKVGLEVTPRSKVRGFKPD